MSLVLDPGGNRLDSVNGPREGGGVRLLVGPEGGLTGAETEMLRRHQFHACRLGPRILRTETAAVAAVALVMARWGDLGGFSCRA
ncbi:MAG: RsmE family RNA methyltransferase [Acidobacteriota bacterium]